MKDLLKKIKMDKILSEYDDGGPGKKRRQLLNYE